MTPAKAVKIISVDDVASGDDVIMKIGSTNVLKLTKDAAEQDKLKVVRLEIGASDPNVVINTTDNRIKVE